MGDASDTTVVALGGNAISVPGEKGTIEQQQARSRRTARVLCDALERGLHLVVTHGNGPQVGNVLRRSEIASRELYPIPLEVCVADTQAGMGYVIGQSIMNELAERGRPQDVITMVTTVVVDMNDPAFADPTKPIGPRMPVAVARAHRDQEGWCICREQDGSYRRVVPSPRPQEILELAAIRDLVVADELVICCGGGGIPVCRDEIGRYRGAAVVIDKDRTTALMARSLSARQLVILTGVEQVCLNFGTPDEQPLRQLTATEAQRHLTDGQFAAGSMGPKVEAAIDFVTNTSRPDATALICHCDRFIEALDGNSGTVITR